MDTDTIILLSMTALAWLAGGAYSTAVAMHVTYLQEIEKPGSTKSDELPIGVIFLLSPLSTIFATIMILACVHDKVSEAACTFIKRKANAERERRKRSAMREKEWQKYLEGAKALLDKGPEEASDRWDLETNKDGASENQGQGH